MSDDDPISELGSVLREAGIRVTFDRHRSVADPCYLCGTTAAPRDLFRIGTYTRPMGGNLRPGDAIVRPLCERCREATEPPAPAGLAVGAVVEWVDALDSRRRGEVYRINTEGRVFVAERMLNRRGRPRRRLVTHHFDAHEVARLRVVEAPPGAPTS